MSQNDSDYFTAPSGMRILTDSPAGRYWARFAQTKIFLAQMKAHFAQLNTVEVENLIKEAAMALIPVRSGRLLDTILDTIKVELVLSTSDSLYFDLTYTHGLHRPDPIKGRTKHGPLVVGTREFGLGEDYIPKHSIPNVKRIATGTQIQNTNTSRQIERKPL